MSVVNIYDQLPAKFRSKKLSYKNYDDLKIDLPCRALIIGASGSGKTNLLLNLIARFSCFTRIYLFSKELEEPLYRYLINTFEKLGEKVKKQMIFYSNDPADIPSYDAFDPNENNLVIFDDLINEKTKELAKVGQIFTMGRKKNISSFFLSQSYFKIPLIVRQNSDYVFALRINSQRDLNRILSEYQLSVSLDQLRHMYLTSTKAKGDFLMLDLNHGDDLRYRHNFEPFALHQTEDGDDNE